MRVGIVGLRHESNTFLSTVTDFHLWEVQIGDDARDRWLGTHNEIGGYLAGLEAEGISAVPVYSALATPAGTITADAMDELTNRMLAELAVRGPYDGILAAAHGAAVSEMHRDADGHWLGRLRASVGPDMPIVCTVDAHANLSQRMLDATDVLISYRSNPHLDTHDRGLEASRLIARIVRGEVRPTQVGAFPPVAINILQQGTTVEPCLPLYELADAMRGRPGVLSVSICLGFPYADVPEMGTSFNVVTDGDRGLARRTADELAAHLVARRHEFVPEFISAKEAVEMAAAAPGPACLLDMGDNVGGGSAADGTILASVVHERGGPKTFVALFDPEGVAAARDAGPGAEIELEVGGKTDELHGPPLAVRATVRSLHDGKFVEPDVRHGGNPRFDMGETAILDTDRGLTIQLTSNRVPPFSLGQITSCGLEPTEFQILVAKGVHAPVPAYEPVCATILRVNTPGATSADMLSLPFVDRRRPLFPFEDIDA
jgi:microcystin degradation protein MlrC